MKALQHLLLRNRHSGEGRIRVESQLIPPSPQRKLGSSVFCTTESLDPSFRWDDEHLSGDVLPLQLKLDTNQDYMYEEHKAIFECFARRIETGFRPSPE
jgi:hypothetical protein